MYVFQTDDIQQCFKASSGCFRKLKVTFTLGTMQMSKRSRRLSIDHSACQIVNTLTCLIKIHAVECLKLILMKWLLIQSLMSVAFSQNHRFRQACATTTQRLDTVICKWLSRRVGYLPVATRMRRLSLSDCRVRFWVWIFLTLLVPFSLGQDGIKLSPPPLFLWSVANLFATPLHRLTGTVLVGLPCLILGVIFASRLTSANQPPFWFSVLPTSECMSSQKEKWGVCPCRIAVFDFMCELFTAWKKNLPEGIDFSCVCNILFFLPPEKIFPEGIVFSCVCVIFFFLYFRTITQKLSNGSKPNFDTWFLRWIPPTSSEVGIMEPEVTS